jgi:CDP-diacylglycerol--glycerol-3-phosphate 3-phosphatidyltransferase
VLAAAAFDSLDGALARRTGRASLFGAFIDSTLDRFSEAALYLGLLTYYARRGGTAEVVLIYLTIVGSLLVSYTRARAEGLGLECKVGLFDRFLRVIVFGAGLIVSWMLPSLIVLAAGSNFTALQRIVFVYRMTEGRRRTTREA